MKTTFKKPIVWAIAILMFAGFSISFSSCSDDDDSSTPVDKTALQSAINDAKAMLNDTEEGINDGQYPTQARTALQAAITAAEAVNADATVNQTSVNNAVVSLNLAVDTYEAAKITPVAAEALVAHWSFDEGTGTVAHDEANGFDGTFKTGAQAWGAGTPVWATDRKGQSGKAIHFDDGANIEIPYNTNLNPKQMTVALWINADEINADNRFLGLHSWNGYKFQLQSANRPFFTMATQDDQIFDRDSEQDLPIQEWHHIAVTFGGGNMVFYVDGTPIKTWDNTPGEGKSIAGTPYNLVIGQDFPTDQYAATTDNYDNDHKIPLEWGGYFRGFLDEVRIYNTVLTDAQIESIYNREKP